MSANGGLRPSETGEFSDWSFSPRELVGVHLGPHCSETDQADILRLLARDLEHVAVFHARLSQKV